MILENNKLKGLNSTEIKINFRYQITVQYVVKKEKKCTEGFVLSLMLFIKEHFKRLKAFLIDFEKINSTMHPCS